MLDKFRHALFLKALRRVLDAQNRSRKTFTLESAVRIGLLFDASDEAYRSELLDLSRSFEKKGKKIQLLGFFNSKMAPDGTKFPQFTLKNCRWWTQVPNSENATTFARETFDLVLCINPNHLDPLHHIAASSKAMMKMGYATELPNDYDILMDTSTQNGPRHFIQQLELYLDKIVLSKHEPAGAL